MTTIALSHSRLNDFQQCPLKFKLKYLEKAFPVEDPNKSPHLVRGGNVHKQLENYVVKKISGQAEIPPSTLPEVENTKPMIDKFFLEFETVMPEAKLAVNSSWSKVDWFDSDAYYRAQIDLIAMSDNVGLVVDWKTGKVNDYSGYGGQLHLTAAMVMSVFPQFEELTTAYAYVDHKRTYPIQFQRAELPALVEHFDNESKRVNSEKEWGPTPNEFCNWCAATKSQCKYSRKL